MSTDTHVLEVHLDTVTDGDFLQITTFEKSMPLLSGCEPLDEGKFHQLYIYPTAVVTFSENDMMKGIVVAGVHGIGDCRTTSVPRTFRIGEPFCILTNGIERRLGVITHIIQESLQSGS